MVIGTRLFPTIAADVSINCDECTTITVANAPNANVYHIEQFKTYNVGTYRQIAYGPSWDEVYTRISTTSAANAWGPWYRVSSNMVLLWSGSASFSNVALPTSYSKFKYLKVFYSSLDDSSVVDPTTACSYLDIPIKESDSASYNRALLTHIKLSVGAFVGQCAIPAYVDSEGRLRLGSRVVISGTGYEPLLVAYKVYGCV